MIDCRKTRILGRCFFKVRRLYLTAFPKIERHPVMELFSARERYNGKDVVLLIESLREDCGNMDIRIRRKGFYLRNGFHDTGFLQRSFGGEANYDILSTAEQFDEDAYRYMLANYPFRSYLEDISS